MVGSMRCLLKPPLEAYGVLGNSGLRTQKIKPLGWNTMALSRQRGRVIPALPGRSNRKIKRAKLTGLRIVAPQKIFTEEFHVRPLKMGDN